MERDLILLKRYAQAGDAIAFTELTRRYRAMVFSTAHRITRNHHDAEDITQSCFMELARQAGIVAESVPGWLHTKATSRAIETIRSDRARIKREKQAAEIGAAMLNESPDWAKVSPALDQAVEQLPDEFRLPIILYFFQSFTQTETAEILDISQRTVSTRLKQGVQILRAHLGEAGLAIPLAVLVPLLHQNGTMACPIMLQTSLAKIGIAGIGLTVPSAPAGGMGIMKVVIGFGAAPASMAKVLILMFFMSACAIYMIHQIAPEPPGLYEHLSQAYQPYLSMQDAMGFPLKMRALTASPYSLHVGAPEVLFNWLKTHHPVWLAKPRAYVTCHGSLHPGNLGVYMTQPSFGRIELGLLDYDESSNMPMEVELMQGLASLALISQQPYSEISWQQLRESQKIFLDSYRRVIVQPNASLSVEANQYLQTMTEIARRESYDATLEDYVVSSGGFGQNRNRKSLSGEEILQRTEWNREVLAQALAQAVANSPCLASVCRYQTPEQFREAILDVVRRTRLLSLESQSQTKYLVLLRRPLVGADHDAIVLLKQQIPSAWDRSMVLTDSDLRTPAHRVYENTLKLAEPDPGFFSWCEFDGRSFTIELREPWSKPMVPRAIVRPDQLKVAAELMGLTAGRSHRHAGQDHLMALQLTDSLQAELLKATDRYVVDLQDRYRELCRDSRTRRDRMASDAAIHSYAAYGYSQEAKP